MSFCRSAPIAVAWSWTSTSPPATRSFARRASNCRTRFSSKTWASARRSSAAWRAAPSTPAASASNAKTLHIISIDCWRIACKRPGEILPMSASAYVFDATEETFQTAVVERSHEVPVVVDFWAPWCAPCRTLGPILERLVAARNGAIVLAKVNTDENPGLAQYFQIEGIPAVKAIKGGQLVLQFEGLLPEASIEGFLDQDRKSVV